MVQASFTVRIDNTGKIMGCEECCDYEMCYDEREFRIELNIPDTWFDAYSCKVTFPEPPPTIEGTPNEVVFPEEKHEDSTKQNWFTKLFVKRKD